MARWEIKNVNIAGVAMAVPEHTVKTAEIDLFSQEEADVFDKTVGIKSRHIAPDTMCASDMCQAAGEKLLASYSSSNMVAYLPFIGWLAASYSR